MAFIANNSNPQGGGVPGQARNTLGKYPPKPRPDFRPAIPAPIDPGGIGGGFANTKPRYAPRSRYTPSPFGPAINDPGFSRPLPGHGGPDASTGQEELNGKMKSRGFGDDPLYDDSWRVPDNGDVMWAGGQGPNDLTNPEVYKRFLAANPHLRDRFGGGNTTNPTRGTRPSLDMTNPTPAPSGADRPGMGWRASRRAALQSGALERTEDGFAPTNPGDATGADRAGMDWRAQRRAAKRSGAMDATGADRIGMGYRRDRRQAARAAGAPPAKPGQPPPM